MIRYFILGNKNRKCVCRGGIPIYTIPWGHTDPLTTPLRVILDKVTLYVVVLEGLGHYIWGLSQFNNINGLHHPVSVLYHRLSTLPIYVPTGGS